MNRSADDIINKFLEYKDDTGAMEAMADLMVFMGVPEGSDFLKEALERKEQLQQEERQIKRDYARYLKAAGARNYISFGKYKEKRAAGQL